MVFVSVLDRVNFYEPINIATIMLLLRRTLVHSVILSAMCSPSSALKRLQTFKIEYNRLVSWRCCNTTVVCNYATFLLIAVSDRKVLL